MILIKKNKFFSQMFYPNIPAGTDLKSMEWTLAEFRHSGIVQLPHENYYNVCRQHKEK